MTTRKLTAEVLSAGTLPDIDDRYAGWLRLSWEHEPGVFHVRQMIVSRERAEQAVRALLTSPIPEII